MTPRLKTVFPVAANFAPVSFSYWIIKHDTGTYTTCSQDFIHAAITEFPECVPYPTPAHLNKTLEQLQQMEKTFASHLLYRNIMYPFLQHVLKSIHDYITKSSTENLYMFMNGNSWITYLVQICRSHTSNTIGHLDGIDTQELLKKHLDDVADDNCSLQIAASEIFLHYEVLYHNNFYKRWKSNASKTLVQCATAQKLPLSKRIEQKI